MLGSIPLKVFVIIKEKTEFPLGGFPLQIPIEESG